MTFDLIKSYCRKTFDFVEKFNKVQVALIGLVAIFAIFQNKLFPLVWPLLSHYWQYVFAFIAICVLIYVFIQTQRLIWRFTVGFQDKFKEPLNKNWNYTGDWKIEDKNELSVTDCDSGGITNVGSLWENYVFEFETKILNKCSSWIVRATDLNNYIMFQCSDKLIRPHLRLKLPKITKTEADGKISFVEQVGWIVDNPPFNGQPHNKELNGWFKVKIVCKGSRVDIYINDDNIYHSDSVLTIPIGKVGFRNSGSEHMHVRNVKVSLI